MKKILEGSSRRIDTIFGEVDTNFIEVCNSIMRIAYPDDTLKGYANDAAEPAAPTTGDCYLVTADSEIWGIDCYKDQILRYTGIVPEPDSSGSGSGSGSSDWEILPFKITEINEAIQYYYFDADKIVITPIDGITGADVQAALEEIAAALVLHGLLVPAEGSGSGSGSGSGGV